MGSSGFENCSEEPFGYKSEAGRVPSNPDRYFDKPSVEGLLNLVAREQPKPLEMTPADAVSGDELEIVGPTVLWREPSAPLGFCYLRRSVLSDKETVRRWSVRDWN